jgi:hypothetical protein
MMMRRQSLHRIDNSNSGRRRVALEQRTLISVRADIPPIDLIDIPAPTGSPTLIQLIGNLVGNKAGLGFRERQVVAGGGGGVTIGGSSISD